MEKNREVDGRSKVGRKSSEVPSESGVSDAGTLDDQEEEMESSARESRDEPRDEGRSSGRSDSVRLTNEYC